MYCIFIFIQNISSINWNLLTNFDFSLFYFIFIFFLFLFLLLFFFLALILVLLLILRDFFFKLVSILRDRLFNQRTKIILYIVIHLMGLKLILFLFLLSFFYWIHIFQKLAPSLLRFMIVTSVFISVKLLQAIFNIKWWVVLVLILT